MAASKSGTIPSLDRMPFPSHIADLQPFVELHISSWASVYKAYQPSLDRVVLLKVLNPQFSKDADNASWFASEAQLTAKVKHPNVVSVYGYGESKDGLYFTTEFVEGVTLREIIDRGPVPYPIAVYIAEQMLAGLQAAHKQGVLHRDVKPENVLVSYEGYVKLCDFGFASAIHEDEHKGDIRGTIGYMAPEMMLDGAADEGSDVFSLGGVFYELLTGQPAYGAKDVNDYLNVLQHHDPAASLDSYTFIPEEVRNLCIQLANTVRSERLGSVGEALDIIRSIQKSQNSYVSPEVLSAWWENPESFQWTAVTGRAVPDRAPEVRAQPKKERKAFKGARIASLALIVLAVAALFFNGVAQQAELPVTQAEEINGEASLNTVVLPAVEADSLAPVVDEEQPVIVPPDFEQPKDRIVQTEPLSNEESILETTIIEEDEPEELPMDSLTLDDPGEGAITVLCLPSCTVWIGEQEKGSASPMVTLNVPVGDYLLQLKNSDFPDYEQNVTIHKNGHDTLSVSLLESLGTLELVVSPWGEVFIDSTSYGVFPPAVPLRIWPGEHTLRVVHAEYGERTLTFTIGKNERLTRTINFNEN